MSEQFVTLWAEDGIKKAFERSETFGTLRKVRPQGVTLHGRAQWLAKNGEKYTDKVRANFPKSKFCGELLVITTKRTLTDIMIIGKRAQSRRVMQALTRCN
jgi:hypothetical protein